MIIICYIIFFIIFQGTSNGIEFDLTTRRTSGDDGHCIKYHMKLHIYVCNPKEGKICLKI